MGRVDGKVAMVTGGAMGMGAAHARLLAREGARVVLTDVEDAAGEAVAQAIRADGGEALYLHQDVTDERRWGEVIDQTVSRYGGLDVLVNNAGILVMKPLQETTLAEWERVFAVNVTGVFLGTRAAFEPMRARGGGSIINISSIYGLVGAPQAAAYEATKGAVRLLTKAAANDYARFGIRVNSVHPGVIRTRMTEGLLADPEVAQAILGPTLLRRAAEPEEVSQAVLFLASDESSFVDGSELVVDGGYTAA